MSQAYFNSFEMIKMFFNSKKRGKVFTRAEYFARFANTTIGNDYLDQIRLYLTHAGYLTVPQRGVYLKTKKIPFDLTYTQLRQMAYPKWRSNQPKAMSKTPTPYISLLRKADSK